MALLAGNWLSSGVADAIRPRPVVSTRVWAAANITLPRGSEIRGKFRLDLFPHVLEPLDAFDDPSVRSISLQWASRLGKTVFIQTCLAKTAACNPHPMALADADETSTKRVLRRLWRVLENVPALASQVPPRRLQSAVKIDLSSCLIHGAWSGSPTSAADYAALVVALNELDKMSRRQSDEADFAYLMEERAKGFPRSKILRVSTPTVRGESRVEAARLAGDNRRRCVPCPHCGHWQTLRTGTGKTPGGLRWAKPSSGHSDPALALETAWYECEACERKILNEQRYELLNAGRWVREGEEISGSGTITGTPVRPGPDATFGPLSTLYSLLPSITWGVCAKAFLDSRPNLERRRNYRNSWEGETWDPAPPAASANELADRLCAEDLRRGIVPAWAAFLTMGIDCQLDQLVWMVAAWGENCRGAAIDWGRCGWSGSPDDFSLVMEQAGSRLWPRECGGPLRVLYALVDSGDQTQRVYTACDRLRGVDPAKGSSYDFPSAYRYAHRGGKKLKYKRSGARPTGPVLIEINSDRSQHWIEQNITREITRAMHGFFQLPAEARFDVDLLGELLNETRIVELDSAGARKTIWKRRDHNHPNDLRDCARIAWTAAQVTVRSRWTGLPTAAAGAAESSDAGSRTPRDEPRIRQPERRAGRIRKRGES